MKTLYFKICHVPPQESDMIAIIVPNCRLLLTSAVTAPPPVGFLLGEEEPSAHAWFIGQDGDEQWWRDGGGRRRYVSINTPSVANTQ